MPTPSSKAVKSRSSRPGQTRSYHAHRERQRRRILGAAQELFDSHGIDRVTLADIVKTTGVRPTTIYEYFANKDEIVWALVEEHQQQTSQEFRERLRKVDGDTLAKISAMLECFADELSDHPDRVRFQAQFDAMYAQDGSVERLLAIEDKLFPSRLKHFADLIREGIADGSLRSDLNPKLTIHSVLNSVIGAQRRLASLSGRIEKEYGQPTSLLFREAIRIILLGLRRN